MTVYEGYDIPRKFQKKVKIDDLSGNILIEKLHNELTELEMGSIKNSIDKLIENIDKTIDSTLYDRVLNIDADIKYENTEDNKVKLTISKNNQSKEYIFDTISKEVKDIIDKKMTIRNKKKSKNEAKSISRVKYRIGDILILKSKVKDGSKRYYKKFEVKKVIWSVKNSPVNILILKQLEGINNNLSLDKNDCKKYHIKYEPGLQAYSMMLNFVKCKKI